MVVQKKARCWEASWPSQHGGARTGLRLSGGREGVPVIVTPLGHEGDFIRLDYSIEGTKAQNY